jgi:hypothetical protein
VPKTGLLEHQIELSEREKLLDNTIFLSPLAQINLYVFMIFPTPNWERACSAVGVRKTFSDI